MAICTFFQCHLHYWVTIGLGFMVGQTKLAAAVALHPLPMQEEPWILRGAAKHWIICNLDATQICDLIDEELSFVYAKARSHDDVTTFFPYYDAYQASRYPHFVPEYEFINARLEDIIDTSGPSVMYYSGSATLNQFKNLGDTMPFDELTGAFSIHDYNYAQKQPEINFWFAPPGIQIPAHYDAAFNIFTQLSGRKRVRLFAPQEAIRLGLYGRLHPYTCQSRFADVLQNRRFNRSTSTVPSSPVNPRLPPPQLYAEYELVEGDVLYIPPFWFHEVATVGTRPSASVSLWWDAPSLDVMDDVLGIALPFEASWTIAQARQYGQEFADIFLDALDSLHQELLRSCNCSHSLTSSNTFSTEVLTMLRERYAEAVATRIENNGNHSDEFNHSHLRDTTVTTESTEEAAREASSARSSYFEARARAFVEAFSALLRPGSFAERSPTNADTGNELCKYHESESYPESDSDSGIGSTSDAKTTLPACSRAGLEMETCREICHDGQRQRQGRRQGQGHGRKREERSEDEGSTDGDEPTHSNYSRMRSRMAILTMKVCDWLEDMFDLIVHWSPGTGSPQSQSQSQSAARDASTAPATKSPSSHAHDFIVSYVAFSRINVQKRQE